MLTESLIRKREASRKWADQNKERLRRYRASRRASDVGRDKAAHDALMYRFKQHNLTLDQYHALAEKQDFRCAICGVVPDDNYGGSHDGFHIDHCHVTGRIRGLLCKHCNVGIGMLKDSEEVLQSAIQYLRLHQEIAIA